MDPIPNPFAPNHSDSDSDSVSCFVTDLFESRSSDRSRPCSCHDISINPFSGVVCDLHHGELGLGLGFGGGDDSVGDNSGGLRVVGFGSDSDSNSEEGELDRAMEFSSGVDGDDDRVGVGGAFDDFDVRLCWDSLCLEDQRTLNESFEWEEVEERVNEVEVDGESIASGFTNSGEEAIRDLEWEILLAVNNLDRNSGLEHDDSNGADSYLAVPEGFFYTAEVDVLFGQLLENDNGLKGSPPAAKSVVENLPLVVVEELQGKNVVCAICKDEMFLEEKVRRLPCSHCYHGDCILPWLSIRNTCPVCRFELPTDDPDYEQRKCQRAAHELLELAAQMQF
ncbi:E3 ubiquitin-protein ligase CIP8-like [Gastrolobium bilobum]|uniref:E3 ubiquitin-protein ligase CIP8-like n=1 Tax=Gastrolobium bilobum TaxID=150636 RepID=UPI002AB11FA9|nr:E3 ubiquitin-protein ligase CIP8-like [Gastrolobium bilobum]XP_061367808.1 E3 ubiquitin-protein ligase CIP8-like [Gastrolobium bilobum]